MKIILIALSLILDVIAISDEEEWEKFKVQHQKLYANRSEEVNRYDIFRKNLQLIREHNKKFERGQSTFRMGVNKFTDMTEKELRQCLRHRQSIKLEGSSKFKFFHSRKNLQVPDSVNWTARGAVTSVKTQGDCASCWTFATVGTIEAQYFLKTGKLVSLSAQNLLDCDKANFGCEGGEIVDAYKYIIENGIHTEEAYPYHGKEETCKANSSSAFLEIRSIEIIPEDDENELMRAVATIGPLSASIHMNFEFHVYESGILEDPLCLEENAELNHGVLIVGYGTENGTDYWLVKNSWGLEWGEYGYAKMLRNHNNMCKIATEAIYPVL